MMTTTQHIVFVAATVCMLAVMVHGGRCIKSCTGKAGQIADGDYQSCRGCDVYATCSNGNLHDNRPCAPKGLFWDDNIKRCEHTSTTCQSKTSRTTTKTTRTKTPGNGNGRCITSCDGRADGDYQSCQGCGVYATCSNEILHDNRPCAPKGLVWDDKIKRCERTSTTCP